MCATDTFIDSYVGMFIGGGRDNKLHGNHCPSTHTCVHVDNRGMNWEQTSCNASVCQSAGYVALQCFWTRRPLFRIEDRQLFTKTSFWTASHTQLELMAAVVNVQERLRYETDC